ncbi:hypothetical protein COLO4_11188 [Corchorus olitorius]|uniref:Uncharacterized protein n=1 Tax=Corchorus olitorius TaxID=93759 RepID=A0A1R3K5R9_9ROSI|nr:hypothetical protein COLO4_11188 [Corchorus olitorius]
MQARSLSLSQKSLGVKQHDNFITRINLSLEDFYHGGASVAVPFNWESQPGTPKVKRREIPTLPPLTPPPSYFYATPKRTVKNQYSKPKLLDTILPRRRSRRKTREQVSPASSKSSSSSSSSSTSSSRSSSPWPRSSYSVPSSPNVYGRNELGRLFSNSRAHEEEEHEHEHDDEYESSVSTPCFGRGTSVRSRSIYSSMLKVFLRDQ